MSFQHQQQQDQHRQLQPQQQIPCFPLLDFIQNLLGSKKRRRSPSFYSSVFVYDKSWKDEESEEDTLPSSSCSSTASTSSSEQQHQHTMGDDAKTHYPHFDDVEESSGSDNDEESSLAEGVNARRNTSTSIKDRVIFTTVSGLLVRSQSLGSLEIIDHGEHDDDEAEPPCCSLKRTKSAPLIIPTKRFRWSEVTDSDPDALHVETHEVECWKDRNDLWWNSNEYSTIKRGVMETIRFCKSYHRSHIELLEEIIRHDEEDEEDHFLLDTVNDDDDLVKALLSSSDSSDAFSRGLEGHMSKLINRYRKKHSRKVLNAQVACRYKDQSKEQAWDTLREQSIEKSKALTSFARKMGQFDEMEAVAANKVTSLWGI